MYSCFIHYKNTVFFSSGPLFTVNFSCFMSWFIKHHTLLSFDVSSLNIKQIFFSHWVAIELYLSVALLIIFSGFSIFFNQEYNGIDDGLKLHLSMYTVTNFNFISFHIISQKKIILSSSNPFLRNLGGRTFTFLQE